MPAFLDGRTMAIVKGADGVDLITYPIGGGLVNWVVQVPEAAPGPLPGDAGWNAPGRPGEVLRHLDALETSVAGRSRHGRAAPSQVLEYPMVDRDVLPWWGAAASRCSAMPPTRCIPLAPTAVRRPSSTRACSPRSCRATPTHGLRRYEDQRRRRDGRRHRRQPRDAPHRRHAATRRPRPRHRQIPERHQHRQESTHDHLRPDPRRLPRRLVLRRSRRRPAHRKATGC